MGAKVDTVREKLKEVYMFLEPFKILANAHMTSFITGNSWEILPEDLRNEASSLSIPEMYEIFWNWGSDPGNFQQTSAIGKFLNACWHFSLASQNFKELMLSYKSCQTTSNKSAKCMSLKKSHEVVTLKEIVAYLCDDSQSNCVVDVGGGKGYLGASLVLESKMKVLSIDSKPLNTEGAMHIFEKLEKHERVQADSSAFYKQVTAFVTPETDIIAIAKDNFGPTSEYRICLTGLHVCGNLASTCIKLFSKAQDIASICSIGCCYNLLTERFETESDVTVDKYNCGFPLSDFLNKKSYCLGRNARMIACQPIDRICLEKREMKPSIFWRAAIQTHFQELLGPGCDVSVGRRCSKATSFSDYCLKVEQSLKIDLELTEDKMNNLIMQTEKLHADMIKFYCFRLALAPVVEALLILDRLLFLYEQGLETSYICKAFDGATSPRCHAVIASRPSR
ncbi:methyltransferase-like protein 25 [Thrips palmi]|uniref:Methyltransferase-like protein 25 n=1 Tax=Thrips palmi TaxID=161013 RepID=A0A6P8Z5R9_THRPL|nr:methyltransferase-like protein 25 [Thrips palmi]